ncbi:hypothetical protein ACFOZ0_07975 [Streptomyces yaanensis]|uniref:Secreted protein n=1 Tax=Streptomyces yaanensis TaxID=1142239 RepID=A0ABV7SA29_9ACTN|nr:hypothetical protein [Streptomyces sp. CGMCC 4.7035]WNC02716.1 hypothetical protein Q2K21_34245 [Streptomyces sp. CGMCC 4.7035]
MSENSVNGDQSQPTQPTQPSQPPQIGPVEPAASTVVLPEGVTVRRPVRRGRVAALTGSVLLAAALVAGVGYTVVTVNGADRDAGAPSWKFPAVKKDAEAKKASGTGLAGMLVPYGTDGFTRGPDIGQYGADAELSGREATALRKESLHDLPRSQRLRLERQIDRQHIKGMALRSYLSTSEAGNSTAYADRAFTVDVVLAQMANRAAVRDIATFQSEFLSALDVFRKGPTIKGHKNAHCFLPPKEADEKLDVMFCSAYQGDVLVTATAYAARPMDTTSAALLLRTQLDRIAEPGEAV